jgi:hypothetical protein
MTKLSLFNVEKRVRFLEKDVPKLTAMIRSPREDRFLGFIRTVGAIWGIGAYIGLIVLAIHG